MNSNFKPYKDMIGSKCSFGRHFFVLRGVLFRHGERLYYYSHSEWPILMLESRRKESNAVERHFVVEGVRHSCRSLEEAVRALRIKSARERRHLR